MIFLTPKPINLHAASSVLYLKALSLIGFYKTKQPSINRNYCLHGTYIYIVQVGFCFDSQKGGGRVRERDNQVPQPVSLFFLCINLLVVQQHYFKGVATAHLFSEKRECHFCRIWFLSPFMQLFLFLFCHLSAAHLKNTQEIKTTFIRFFFFLQILLSNTYYISIIVNTVSVIMITAESETAVWDYSPWLSPLGLNGVLDACWDTCYQNVKQRGMWKKAQNSSLRSCDFTG